MPTSGEKLASLKVQVDAVTMNVGENIMDIADLKARVTRLETWAAAEADWSREVTDLLHMINWAALTAAFPGTGGTNPPKTAPTWPPS